MENQVISKLDVSLISPPTENFLVEKVNISPSLENKNITDFIRPLIRGDKGAPFREETINILSYIIGLEVLKKAQKDVFFTPENKKLVTTLYTVSWFQGNHIYYVYRISSESVNVDKNLWVTKNLGENGLKTQYQCCLKSIELPEFNDGDPFEAFGFDERDFFESHCFFPKVLVESTVQMFRFLSNFPEKSTKEFLAQDLGFLEDLVVVNNKIPKNWDSLGLISPDLFSQHQSEKHCIGKPSDFNCQELIEEINFSTISSIKTFLEHVLYTAYQVQEKKDFSVLKASFQFVHSEILHFSFEILEN